MGSVSLPVNVFCWLGWNEQMIVRPSGSRASVPWPKRGRGRSPTTAASASCSSKLAGSADFGPSAATGAAGAARSGANQNRDASC